MSTEEQPDYWTDIEAGLYSTSLKRREASTKALLSRSQGETWSKEDLVHVCDLIFQTLVLFDDTGSTKAIEELIKNLAARPDFIPPFLAQWTRSCTEILKRSTSGHYPKTLVKLFRWSCSLFLGLPDNLHPALDNTTAFSSITTNQSSLLGHVSTHFRSNPESLKNLCHLFKNVLQTSYFIRKVLQCFDSGRRLDTEQRASHGPSISTRVQGQQRSCAAQISVCRLVH